MGKNEIIKSIAERTGGELYLGVVGAVRTGKSTLIKKIIESLVVSSNAATIKLDELKSLERIVTMYLDYATTILYSLL